MAYESRTGLGVMSQYGPRETGLTVGVEHSKDSHHQLSFELTGKELASKFLPPLVLPKGAIVKDATITVDQAFGGLTNIAIGEGNDEATNGIVLLLADLNTLGTKNVTTKLTGEWAANAGTTQASRIGLAVTGTPTANIGKASLTITYYYKKRRDDEWEPDAGTQPTGYRPQFV